MNKTDFIHYCAQRAGFTQSAMRLAFNAIFDSIVDLVAAGENVHFNDFGDFHLQERSARTARNVYSGEQITIPACKTVKFTVGKAFKQAVNEMQNKELSGFYHG